MNLPNKLTVLRVIMIPFFVVFMLTDLGGQYSNYIALVIFCVASLTDMLDGKIARKYNLVTNFGKFMDPLADKLLVGAAMICLIPMDKLPGGIVIAASYWGKFKTVSQMFMIIFLILDLPGHTAVMIETVLIYLALILTVVSLIDYIAKNKEVLTKGGM